MTTHPAAQAAFAIALGIAGAAVLVHILCI